MAKEPQVSENILFGGGCLCGAVRWRALGAPLYAYHCHCKMCQRESGAAFMTGVTFPKTAVQWTTVAPKLYQSSEYAKRGFCGECGSWISWHYLDEKISLTAGSFDHPETIKPLWHVFTESQVPWLKIEDNLPRYKQYPPELGSQKHEN